MVNGRRVHDRTSELPLLDVPHGPDGGGHGRRPDRVRAATIGVAQNDIKKVLAYSTVSQLGYMFLAMGSSAYAAGIFHLTTHAFFKGCLFLGAGSVIHAMHHEQDMRKMGGLVRYLPYTYITFVISTIGHRGNPADAGFFSKDEILWKAYSSGHLFLWALGLAGALLTAFYMFRQVFMTFHGDFRGDSHMRTHLHESPAVMTVPLFVLAGLALFAGALVFPRRSAAQTGSSNGWRR